MSQVGKKVNWKLERLQYAVLEKYNKTYNRYSYGDNIIISGSGRSGTTWISEVLSSLPNHVLVNEPLKNSNSKTVQKLGFTGWGQHIPEAADWPEAKKFFDKLFTARKLNPNYFTSDKPKVQTELWVHKFIRAQYMLPWLVTNFDVKTPIHVIRNPYAVIASQLQHLGFGKNREFDPRIHKKTPHFDHYPEFYNQWDRYFSEMKNYIQVLTLHWALQNKYVLNHPFCHVKWKVIKYEDFLMSPDAALESLSELWGIDFSNINRSTWRKHSYSMINQVPENPEQQIEKWRSHLTEQNIEDIDLVLELVGMKNPDESKYLLTSLYSPVS